MTNAAGFRNGIPVAALPCCCAVWGRKAGCQGDDRVGDEVIGAVVLTTDCPEKSYTLYGWPTLEDQKLLAPIH